MQCSKNHKMQVIKSASIKQTTCRQYRCPICNEIVYSTETAEANAKEKLSKIRAKKRFMLKNTEK